MQFDKQRATIRASSNSIFDAIHLYLSNNFCLYSERDGAPMVEREAHNLEVPGSKPGVAHFKIPFIL